MAFTNIDIMEMKGVIDFLNTLEENNNKPWFDANKAWYLEVKAYFEDFVGDLIHAIEEFDDTIYGLGVNDCTYRFYRDIRFSKDKTPYKTHLGAYICPKGKKSGLGGYYFHIEGKSHRYLQSHILATGVVCLPSNIIRSIREDVYSLCEEFETAVGKADGFYLDQESKTKLPAKDFPKDCKAAEYLKLRDFILNKPIDEKYITSPNLVERLAEDFARTKDFKDFINRAIRAEQE